MVDWRKEIGTDSDDVPLYLEIRDKLDDVLKIKNLDTVFFLYSTKDGEGGFVIPPGTNFYTVFRLLKLATSQILEEMINP